MSFDKAEPAPRRPKLKLPYDQTVQVLQGGGALGAYQGGVYQALAEADLHPHWVAGISIGAINSALIAGNPPERRVERLREFWETVTRSPLGASPAGPAATWTGCAPTCRWGPESPRRTCSSWPTRRPPVGC